MSFDLGIMSESENVPVPTRELNVSFGYQRVTTSPDSSSTESNYPGELIIEQSKIWMRSSSFSCLSGAALSANATLANTNICNGLIGGEILPSLDSPKSFRRMPSSPSLSRLDLLSSSSKSYTSSLDDTENDFIGCGRNFWKSMSAPTRTDSSSFLNAMDVQMAGGAAGEDRVQAVCSEENGWLFCGIYDGFNGRDAADFLAGTLYENIGFYLHLLEWQRKKHHRLLTSFSKEDDSEREGTVFQENVDSERNTMGVIDCLSRALSQAENDFMYMVEQEMEDRPDLVAVGSCVLVVLLQGNDIYILNLGDSRAVLATIDAQGDVVRAIQLTEIHNVENLLEWEKILSDHPDDPSPIVNGRVKGKLRLTRAFGVGYLKKSHMNDMLMGLLQVQNLCSPPYVYTDPFTTSHSVSKKDQFIVLGSDGLFDFFTNDEVVKLVCHFVQHNPFGDPSKHLIEQLILKAAGKAGFSTEMLMDIPAGRRRKYHDDVTVIVIILGNDKRTSTASTSL